MSYELLIQHGSNIMYPPTVEGVTIEWERKGQPGKLTFEVVKTPGLSFQEGDPFFRGRHPRLLWLCL